VYGKPKGKDNNVANEGQEKRKGASKTELQAMMRAVMGEGPTQAASPEGMPSPLMPGMKGGKRGLPRG
jgi:hypothetical protein